MCEMIVDSLFITLIFRGKIIILWHITSNLAEIAIGIAC